MQLFKVLGLAFATMTIACGSTPNCDEDRETEEDQSCLASTESDEKAGIGDFCDEDGIWTKTREAGDYVALRCNQATLGERLEDRLKCRRTGYAIMLSDDYKYAYCTNDANAYSFLYDQQYGSYKPWHCSEESGPLKVKAYDSSGNILTLACTNQIYRPESGSSSEETSTNTKGDMCKTKSGAEEDVFAMTKLQDFDPENDQVENFDPASYCDAPTDTNAKPADNVSGSFLSLPR
jgi:hypothetical protein